MFGPAATLGQTTDRRCELSCPYARSAATGDVPSRGAGRIVRRRRRTVELHAGRCLQHISELERAVGLRFLERRPVRPTEAGQLALTAAETATHALAAAE